MNSIPARLSRRRLNILVMNSVRSRLVGVSAEIRATSEILLAGKVRSHWLS
jgi:hypothetical protein